MRSLLLLALASLALAANKPRDLLCDNADVVVVVDTSQSISATQFKKIQSYLNTLVSSFSIGPYYNQAQIGGVLFNDEVLLQWSLNKYMDQQSLQQNMATLPYTVGTTNMERALETAYNVLSGTGSRAGTCRAAILFSDGWVDQGSQEQSWANRIRQDLGAQIIAVAVDGIYGFQAPYNEQLLESLAANSANVFTLNALQA